MAQWFPWAPFPSPALDSLVFLCNSWQVIAWGNLPSPHWRGTWGNWHWWMLETAGGKRELIRKRLKNYLWGSSLRVETTKFPNKSVKDLGAASEWERLTWNCGFSGTLWWTRRQDPYICRIWGSLPKLRTCDPWNGIWVAGHTLSLLF